MAQGICFYILSYYMGLLTHKPAHDLLGYKNLLPDSPHMGTAFSYVTTHYLESLAIQCIKFE